MDMYELLKSIYPLRLAPVSDGRDKAINLMMAELPFKIFEFESGTEQTGWVVPDKWEILKANIRYQGKLVYDGTQHPLGVIGYSSSFHGKVDLRELKKHLYYHSFYPDALVYHYKYFYRNWEKDWGFSMPKNKIDRLTEGSYEIELETEHSPAMMKVLEYHLQGELSETVTFIAHDCHAAQANDDIAGVVVGIELMKRLRKLNTRLSYRLLIGPEQFCSVFYLAALTPAERAKLTYGVYLEMLGNDNRLALQESFNGNSLIDKAAKHFLMNQYPGTYVGAFRKVIGNDETVWESPGYEIPCISISRSNPVTDGLPYPEYHSNLDNEEIIHPGRLEESVDAVLGIINILENNVVMHRKFEGHVALSHPQYDLYVDPPTDPSLNEEDIDRRRQWFDMIVRLPRDFDGITTLLDVAIRQDIQFDDLLDYVKKFAEKGLVRLEPALPE